MLLSDVNVLVHAFRSDSSDHDRCHTWLEAVVNGRSRFGLSPQVLSGFLRVVTHPRVFLEPSDLSEAVDFCELLLDQDHCVVLQPGSLHWRIFIDLCRNAEARGNLIPDAWLAALAIESGSTWITLDRDFARFPGLDWKTP
jgi:toxin-antitoxin system PIN domain toxin